MKPRTIFLKTILLLTQLSYLVSCTGGDVKVNSLGLTLEAPMLKQRLNTNDFFILNSQTKKLYFQIECSEDYSSVQAKQAGSPNWDHVVSINCSDKSAIYEMDFASTSLQLEAENNFEFRFVGEKGYSSVFQEKIFFGKYLNSTSSFSVQDYSGFSPKSKIYVTGASQFTYGSNKIYSATEIYLTDEANCLSGGEWQDLNANPTWSLKKDNDRNYIYAKFRDYARNESECVYTYTDHDNVPPIASSLVVNGLPTSSLTKQDLNSISVAASGDPYQMKISSDGLCLSGEWEDYSLLKSDFPVAVQNSLNQISVKFRDKAFNESQCLSASYFHDNIPPSVPVFNLISGSNPGQLTNPVFHVTNVNAGDTVYLYSNGTCSTVLSTASVTLSPLFYSSQTLSVDGYHQFFVKIFDQATNLLDCYGPIYTYHLDRTAPTISSTGHPTVSVSNVASWTETFSSVDVKEYKYKIGESSSTNCTQQCSLDVGYSNWIPVSSQSSVAIDISSLADTNIKLCSCGKDAASNEQSVPTVYTWTKNTSSLKAEIQDLANLPTVRTSANLNLQIGGYLIDQYQYKIGISSSTDCQDGAGYSVSWIPTTSNITDSLSAYSHGNSVKVCVIGRNSSSGTSQPYSLEEKYIFTLDTQGPTITSVDLPSADNYLVGEDVIIGVNFSEVVTVDPANSGAKSIDIKLGGGALSRTADFLRQVSDTKLEFVYKVTTADSGVLGHNGALNISTTGFIKDSPGNNYSYNVITANMSGSGVILKNEVPVVSIEFINGDPILESSNQVEIKASISAIISSNVDVKVFVEVYDLLGISRTTHELAGTIVAGQLSATLTLSGINNTAAEGLRGIAADLRHVSHGYIGTKVIYASIVDDESPSLDGVVVDFVMGSYSLCFLTANGSVYCMGIGYSGELGLGVTSEKRVIPAKVNNVTGATKIYYAGNTSYSTYCASSATNMWCWGHNGYGIVGNNTTTNISIPYSVTGLGLNPELFSTSEYNVCSKNSSQEVKCWGYNSYYNVGVGTTAPAMIPTSVHANIANAFKIISIGSTYARCALVDDQDSGTDHDGYCWGRGDYGHNGLNGITASLPTKLVNEKVKDILEVASGVGCVMGDFDLGTPGYEVKCWGNANSATSYILGSASSVTITSPTNISNLSYTEETYKSESGNFICTAGDYDQLNSDLEIKCWGNNSSGQLGQSDTMSRTTPTEISSVHIANLADLKLGYSNACVKKTNGALWCWGSGFTSTPSEVASADITNFYLGSAAVIQKNAAGGLKCWGSGCFVLTSGQKLPEAGSDIVKISGSNLCFSVDGHLKCVGGGYSFSRFGIGKIALSENLVTYSNAEIVKIFDESYFCFDIGISFLNCRGAAQTVFSKPQGSGYTGLLQTKIPSNVQSLNVKRDRYSFVDNLGNIHYNYLNSKVFGFGKSFSNLILGGNQSSSNILNILTAATINKTFPINSNVLSLATLPEVVLPFASQNNGSYHTCVVIDNGTVKCFANSSSNGCYYGQLGDGTSGVYCPIKTWVLPLIDSLTALSNIAQVATGGVRSCARTNSNILYCWGRYVLGSTDSVFASYMLEQVSKLKMDNSGNIYTLKNDQNLYKALSNSNSFIPIATSVQDFWVTDEGVCVKKSDGNYYCFGSSDASVFGRYFDKLPYLIY